jgi:predicted alpha/beta-fold hydrolase
MENTSLGLYNIALGYCMRKKLKEHREVFEPLIRERGLDIGKEIEKMKGIRDFDKLITVTTQGYGIPDNYYRIASLGQRLKDITIPTLLLSSIDDPVIS